MTHISPATKLRTQVRAILVSEFTSAELTIFDDKLHESLGQDGPVAGIYPVFENEGVRVLDQDTEVAVQVFLRWSKQVQPTQTVDPLAAETYAERVRDATYRYTTPYAGSSEVWDLRLTGIAYEDDPTGNVSRFTATFRAIGQNFAETTA